MNLNKILWFGILFTLMSYSFSVFSAHPTIEENSLNIENLFNKDKETLNYQHVVALSGQIIKQRENYSIKTIATAFILLGDVAINQGDLDRAFQLAKYAKSTNPLDNKIKFRILQQFVLVYMAQGQYKLLLETAQQALNLAESITGIAPSLLALSYRSAAFALLKENKKSLNDLQIVEKHISENIKFSSHIELLHTLALANSYLGNYQTALSIQLNILKLRFNLNKKNNIAQTYYQLGEAYRHLNRLDDAYAVYRESKRHAEKKQAKILIAYAAKGLGSTLLRQKEYTLAQKELMQALQLLEGENLSKTYLETLIELTNVNLLLNNKQSAYQLLTKAELIFSDDLSEVDKESLFMFLAEMYTNKKEFKAANYWQTKLIKILHSHHKENHYSNKNGSLTNEAKSNKQDITLLENNSAGTESKELAMILADRSDLLTYYNAKFKRQNITIRSLIFIIILITIGFFLYCFKQKNKQLKATRNEVLKTKKTLANTLQTKDYYQLSFKQSRTYQYPITVGYLVIENWQELAFRFNKKIMTEVNKTIESLIHSHIGEFDFAGVINDGEYLLLFPHQKSESVKEKIMPLEAKLNLQFFANLGEFSVITRISYATPTFQDIDPYVFLSQLSQSE